MGGMVRGGGGGDGSGWGATSWGMVGWFVVDGELGMCSIGVYAMDSAWIALCIAWLGGATGRGLVVEWA